MAEPTFDRFGRMRYHPEYHPNQRKPWTTVDQQSLIDDYEKLGPERMSLELGRTINTVMQRATELRKKGLMAKPAKRAYHRREMRPGGGDARGQS